MEGSVSKDVRRRTRSVAQRDPVRTRAAILAAATQEFTAKGLNGARVDTIAARSRVNKRMIYHYFGGKEGLYLAVLEETYTAIRSAEIELNLEDLDPLDGMRELVQFTWNYFNEHPEFLSLLATENLHRARYLKQSQKIRAMHMPLVGMISRLLERGQEEGSIRSGIDPVELYVSIAALGFFYMSNLHTLGTIFNRSMDTPDRLAARGRHIVDVVLRYLRP